MHIEPYYWLHFIFISKMIFYHFWLGVILFPKSMGAFWKYWSVKSSHFPTFPLIRKDFDFLGLQFNTLFWTIKSIVKTHAIN